MSEKTQIIITATDQTKAAFQSVQSSLAGLQQSAIGLGPIFGALGAAISIGAFKDAIEGTIKFAAALDDMAEATGASVENLSALASVAKIGGHDFDAVQSSIIKLNKALHGSDDESKGAAKAIAAIGLSIEELRSKDPAEAMLDIAKALDQFADGGGKSAAAMAILGKTGAAALPFLKDLAEKGELVGKITADQAAQAEQYEKNMNKLTASMGSFAKSVALSVIPVLNDLTSQMVAATTASGGFWNSIVNTITSNPLKNIQGQIADTRAALAKMEKDKEQYGYFDQQRYDRLISQEKTLKAVAQARALGGNAAENLDANDRKFLQPKKSLNEADFSPDEKPKKPPNPKSSGNKIDEATRLIQSLDEQIAVKNADAEATDKMTAAEQQAVKVRQQLEAGTLKATAAQRATIEARFSSLAALEREIAAHKEFSDALKKQEEANVKSNQAMLDQIAAAEKAAELFGLNAAQISVVEQARLADAIAIAKQNGASEDQIAVLEEELALREKLSGALIKGEEKSQQQKDAEDAIKAVGEMDEFAKQAARNMETAFADFFMASADGFDDIASNFGKAVQRMIAEAASAQLLKLLFGDMGKTGNIEGIAGKGLSWLADLLPSFDVGTDYVPRDMVAQIHKGERIVPAAQNNQSASAGQPVVQHMNFYGSAEPAQVKRAAAAGARSVLGVANGARRYG